MGVPKGVRRQCIGHSSAPTTSWDPLSFLTCQRKDRAMPSCIGRWRRIKREVKSPSPQTPVELVVPSPPSPRPRAETGELSAVDGTRSRLIIDVAFS